jgi:Tfp pilus assembly protein PilF
VERRKQVGVAAVLVGLVALAYREATALPFVSFDDPEYVLENPFVRHGLDWKGIAAAMVSGHAANWHPVTWITHMVDVSAFGLDPTGPHVVNVVLHAANAVLLFALLVRLTGATWRSALVAALFALHPLRVESVAWISERKDVLSTFFWLATTHAWVAWVRNPRLVRYAGVLALFALGLASKQMLVTLPFTLLLLDFWPLKRFGWPGERERSLAELVREKAPLFALAVVAAAVTFLVQSGAGATRPLSGIPLPFRIANAVDAVYQYLFRIAWPSSLAVFYPYPEAARPPWWIAAQVAGILAVTALAWRRRAANPALLVGWLWFLGTLVPVLGLVQVGNQAFADRYTYVPSIGIFLALAWSIPVGWATSGRRRLAVAAVAILVLGTLVFLTSRQVETWKSDASLFGHALRVSDRNWVAETMVGHQMELAGDVQGALERYRRAIAIRSDAPQALNNLGNLLVTLGRPAEGIPYLREAVRVWPGYVGALSNLGAALAEAGALQEGTTYLREAVRRAPEHLAARYNLAQALVQAGDLEGAAAELEWVTRLAPDDRAARVQLAQIREALRRR